MFLAVVGVDLFAFSLSHTLHLSLSLSLSLSHTLSLSLRQAAVFLAVVGVDLFAFAIVKPSSDNFRAALTLFYKTLQFLAAFLAFGPPVEVFDEGLQTHPIFNQHFKKQMLLRRG